MHCAACNGEIALAPGERVGFRDTCESCRADLHVCLNCSQHDPAAYNECREPGAERLSERGRANRCDWFSPGHREGGETDSRHASEIQGLEALFKK